MKSIHVHYFAVLRESVGQETEVRETDAATAQLFFDELQNVHQWSFPSKRFKLAINDEFTDWETALKDGDHVCFIPPVAGGAPCLN